MAHKDRMKNIGQQVIPPKGTPARQALNKAIENHKKKDPLFDDAVKNIIDHAVAFTTVQNINGAGLPLDTMIREYTAEYNNRSYNYSLRDMPSSFNIMEAFNQFIPSFANFRILREKDYLLSFIDFLDYFTSDEADNNIVSSVELLEEGVIYSYNGTHDVNEISFDCGDEYLKFGVAGISLIRHGSEVSVLMLAGQECDLESESQKLIQEFSSWEKLPSKEHLEPDDELEIQAVPLENSKNLWKTIVLSRIDLDSNSIDVRYVAQDAGRSFISKTDDLSVYIDDSGNYFNSELENIAKKSPKELDKFQPLFEFVKTCLALPAYMQAREESTRIERHPTKFKSIRSRPKYRKLEKLAPTTEKITIRDVACIHSENDCSPTQRAFFAPNIKIETSGYWKKLPIDTVGQDKHGAPIHGRTWVEKTISWVEEPNEKQPLYSSKLDKHIIGENPGTIYVMRSAAHGKDIFKVGLTTRSADIRAEELTRTTGSPDHFLVVEEWEVPDCKLAEKIIHERLEEFRINPRREFFKARYNIIFSVVSEVIEGMRADL